MPDITVASLNTKAVLWMASNVAAYDDFGNPQTVTPVEIKVRWEAGKGEGSNRRATVYVDREIPTGSVMWLGKLVNLPVLPERPKDLMSVVSYKETPDSKGRKPERSVELVLLGTQLPQQV